MEHGIAFNQPHFNEKVLPSAPHPRKQIHRLTGQNSYPSSVDKTIILIPLAVIGESVFCISIEVNLTREVHIWEPPTYQGGAPTAVFETSEEGVAYYQMPSIKAFVDEWKLID